MTCVAVRAVAVVLGGVIALAGCGSAGAPRAAGTTVDELARQLSGTADNATPLEDAIRSANGSRATIDEQVARQLASRTGVVADIWSSADDVSGLACEAWTNGLNEIGEAHLHTFGVVAAAQELLDRMRSDVEAGQVLADSVTFACELAGVEF